MIHDGNIIHDDNMIRDDNTFAGSWYPWTRDPHLHRCREDMSSSAYCGGSEASTEKAAYWSFEGGIQ